MGVSISRLWARLVSKKELRILMVSCNIHPGSCFWIALKGLVVSEDASKLLHG